MASLWKTTFLRTFGFIAWASLSAWLFSVVEHTGKDGKEEKDQLLKSLYISMASKYNMTITDFNNFSSIAHEALSQPKPRWTYAVSLEFVFQAMTTIGYGYITPQTPAGQLLCIFICLLGIPITLLALKSAGELIAKLVNALVTKFESKLLKRAQPKKIEMKSAVILFILMVTLIVTNGALVMRSHGWTFLESVYFWFVTLTTIGFGDYVPEKRKHYLENSITEEKAKKTGLLVFSSMFMTIYAMIGLCVVSSVINSIMAALEELKFPRACPLCVSRKTQDEMNTALPNCSPKRQENSTDKVKVCHLTEM
ncbi:potassium channel subfamily K member 9-like [Stylophora pistillata]|uniref:potassium channel subfamily K member 9-like n=1 Tax=Stylophora pistillata TaxID=50429 RepID=UPI000C053540|nr:potassium channel subfamily K member 9-like [Stylophora pistillata]